MILKYKKDILIINQVVSVQIEQEEQFFVIALLRHNFQLSVMVIHLKNLYFKKLQDLGDNGSILID
jgi:hypothetical protein